ncbi:hypothetical protein [Granulicella sp. dw_53]|uniref:hypothetical protein n=1 Tax=Granulicella sp. dw_53 TaxID=2719792 RepID=UPI001BD2B653|nr:hypothetical protein [Granulicella sp. dw_53]
MGSTCFGMSLLLFSAIGCSTGSASDPTPSTPQPGPQTYFSPYVAGTTNGGTPLTGAKIYAIDDSATKFSQSTFQLQLPQQQGPQVINTGGFNSGQRGLLSLDITTNYIANSSTGVFDAVPRDSKTGSFAMELAGQAGGLVQLVGQPVSPLVAAVQCPSLKTAQPYLFMTIPAGLTNSPSPPGKLAAAWNPKTDTAYGSVDISTDGSKVTFDNIHQYTLPSASGGQAGVPSQQPSSPAAGACGPTVFGNTITVGQLAVSNPNPGSGDSTPPQASVGIGPTGLLVEYNGAGSASVPFPGTPQSLPSLFYDNTLGAGVGAIGLPKPSSALDSSGLVGSQYLGFVYGAGVYSGNPSVPPTGWSSHLASFGFSGTPSSCASVTTATSTLIYGGDFSNDDPTTSSNGFGNCDLAIDLGPQDPSNNGLFPKAKVWLGTGYSANTTKDTDCFHAVAIAGQLKGKYVIFLLGVDTTQPWAIYLMQSN